MNTNISSRQRFSSDFKRKVALEAIQKTKTIRLIASENGIHPSQVSAWKKQALEVMEDCFAVKRGDQENESINKLVAQRDHELDWLASKLQSVLTPKQRQELMDKQDASLSITRQCELLGVKRATVYYHPVEPDPQDELLKAAYLEIYAQDPTIGSRRMTKLIEERTGLHVGRKKVTRIRQMLGLETLLSTRHKA